MNIDQQIREILSHNYPVNDNKNITPTSSRPATEALVKSVSVVGNNNIVVASNLFLWELFVLINICCVMYLLH